MSVGGCGTGGYSEAAAGWEAAAAAAWAAAAAEADVGGGGPDAADAEGCDMRSDWCWTLWMWRTCGSDSSNKLGSNKTYSSANYTIAKSDIQ